MGGQRNNRRNVSVCHVRFLIYLYMVNRGFGPYFYFVSCSVFLIWLKFIARWFFSPFLSPVLFLFPVFKTFWLFCAVRGKQYTWLPLINWLCIHFIEFGSKANCADEVGDKDDPMQQPEWRCRVWECTLGNWELMFCAVVY